MVIEPKKYGVVSLLNIAFQSAPVLAVCIGMQMMLSGLIPTLQIVVTAHFIDTAISIVQHKTAISLIFRPLFIVVALIGYSWISGELVKFAHVRLELAIRNKYRTAVVEKRAKLAYPHIENHETWDLISRVSRTPEIQIKSAYIDVLSMIAAIIQIAGIVILLITQVWWAALLIIAFSVPLFAVAVKSGKATYQANREVAGHKRKYEYLSEVLTGREAVDERTLFGFGGKVNKTWYEQYETARKIEFKTERKWFIKMKTGGVLTAFISFLIIIVLLDPVLTGTVTVGMFISLVNAVFGLVQTMSWELTHKVDQLAKYKEYAKDLTEFAKLEETDNCCEPPSSPSPVFESLQFVNVRFQCPGTEKPVLNGLTFRISAGKHYAFVGTNGAGKTTVTKLLTGLYDQFEGEIYINDKEISEYSQSELKSFYSVIYQDFAKYYVSMKDNIAVGDVNGLEDSDLTARIVQAVGHAELDAAASKLPQGINTPLGKIKEGGQDVSGGEWQRIAMARAMLNPAPVRVLDEPTAALDPLSESRLYEQYEKLSRGKTTIFISHRLGSTKLADEIFVIGDGQVLESGSHGELMSYGGAYAHMYDSQRSWYQ